jgi:hypothetical protein
LILHTIIKYEAPAPPPRKQKNTNSKKFQGVHGTKEHRLFLLDRAEANCSFKVGDRVIHKRKEWVVNGFFGSKQYEIVKWKGLAPLCLELVDPNDMHNYLQVNPGNVRKKR